mgnify:CR=1 FL=1
MNPEVKIILTDNREINITLYPEYAPLSVQNFLDLIDNISDSNIVNYLKANYKDSTINLASVSAAVVFTLSTTSNIIGVAINAIIANIIITANNSINVNAFFIKFLLFR